MNDVLPFCRSALGARLTARAGIPRPADWKSGGQLWKWQVRSAVVPAPALLMMNCDLLVLRSCYPSGATMEAVLGMSSKTLTLQLTTDKVEEWKWRRTEGNEGLKMKNDRKEWRVKEWMQEWYCNIALLGVERMNSKSEELVFGGRPAEACVYCWRSDVSFNSPFLRAGKEEVRCCWMMGMKNELVGRWNDTGPGRQPPSVHPACQKHCSVVPFILRRRLACCKKE